MKEWASSRFSKDTEALIAKSAHGDFTDWHYEVH